MEMIPVVIVLVVGALACWKACHQERGVMTPERQKVYDAAMISMDAPALRKLSAAFDKMGLPEQAEMLGKRAALRELPDELKKQRTEVMQKALTSDNKEAIADVANAFEKEGATGAAQRLRERLEALI